MQARSCCSWKSRRRGWRRPSKRCWWEGQLGWGQCRVKLSSPVDDQREVESTPRRPRPRVRTLQLSLATLGLAPGAVAEAKEQVLGLREQLAALRADRSAAEAQRAAAAGAARAAEAALRGAHDARVAQRQALLAHGALQVGPHTPRPVHDASRKLALASTRALPTPASIPKHVLA
jgi:hypothetical protein